MLIMGLKSYWYSIDNKDIDLPLPLPIKAYVNLNEASVSKSFNVSVT